MNRNWEGGVKLGENLHILRHNLFERFKQILNIHFVQALSNCFRTFLHKTKRGYLRRTKQIELLLGFIFAHLAWLAAMSSPIMHAHCLFPSPDVKFHAILSWPCGHEIILTFTKKGAEGIKKKALCQRIHSQRCRTIVSKPYHLSYT